MHFVQTLSRFHFVVDNQALTEDELHRELVKGTDRNKDWYKVPNSILCFLQRISFLI